MDEREQVEWVEGCCNYNPNCDESCLCSCHGYEVTPVPFEDREDFHADG